MRDENRLRTRGVRGSVVVLRRPLLVRWWGSARLRAGNGLAARTSLVSFPAIQGATLLLALTLGATATEAKVFLTQEEALALAFGEASRAERKTAFLTEEQAQRVAALAGSEPASRVVVYYAGSSQAGAPITAFFDTHMVRTLPETVMVVVGGDSRIVRVDILSFDEPEDYLPKAKWLEQFEGKVLDEDLSTRGAIRAVTGATMSSRAVTETVRRALALHQVVREAATGGGAGVKPPGRSEPPRDKAGSQPEPGQNGGGGGVERDRVEARSAGGCS